jgi:hypothetical protein
MPMLLFVPMQIQTETFQASLTRCGSCFFTRSKNGQTGSRDKQTGGKK